MLQRRILKYQIEQRTNHNSNHLSSSNNNNIGNNNTTVQINQQQPSQPSQQQSQLSVSNSSISSSSTESSNPSTEYLSFTSTSTIGTVNSSSYTTATDIILEESSSMSETAVFASPKTQADGADLLKQTPPSQTLKCNRDGLMPPPPPPVTYPITSSPYNGTNNNSNSLSSSSSTVTPSMPAIDDNNTPRWSVLHNRMKGMDDNLKRGSVLIEHLTEMHKLATSQVISGEEEQPRDQDDDTYQTTTTTAATTSTNIISNDNDTEQLDQDQQKETEETLDHENNVDNLIEAASPSKKDTLSTSTTSTTVSPLSSSSSNNNKNNVIPNASDAIVMAGINLFNDKPKKGIDYFFSCKLLDKTPESVSEFLHTCPLLNKKAIGDYLGDSDQFSILVLEAFIARFNFQDLDFDMGLRQLLYTFRLPGEAQKIDRIVQKFANQFYKDNLKSGLFEDADAIYILAFAIILLNTDVHNPAIKNTMTKQGFIKSLARINNGKDFPIEFVEDLFDRIASDEIKMDPTQVRFPYAVKKGWLNIRVKGKVTEKWSRKWCVLSEGSLYFFRKPTDATPTRYLHPDTVITPKKEVKGKKHCFMVNHSSPPLLMELLQQQQMQQDGKNKVNAKISQQWVYQQMLIMSKKDNRPRQSRFWDAVADKYGSEQLQQQIISMQQAVAAEVTSSSQEILDSDSVSSIDTLSESSAYYEEEVSSISSTSSSPNSPLSTSVPQQNHSYLQGQPNMDPKKKGFSLRFGKQKKDQLANLQESNIPPYQLQQNNCLQPPASPNGNRPSNNGANPTPNHSLTQPRPTLYKNGSGSLLRSSSISTFSTPASQQTTPQLSPSSSSSSSSGNSTLSSTSSTPGKSPSATLMSVIESSPQQIESLMKLQQKMMKTSKQTTCLLSSDSKRDMESWTRLILSQFQQHK